MIDDVVSYEVSLLAREIGFKHALCYFVYDNGVKRESSQIFNREGFELAPTQSLLRKWLRDIYNIQIDIAPFHCLDNEKPYGMTIEYVNNDSWSYHEYNEPNEFLTYEEALETALKESLLLIKSKSLKQISHVN